MKKIWMILLAMLLATGLVVMGCGGGDDGSYTREDDRFGILFQLSTNEVFQALDTTTTVQTGDNITAFDGLGDSEWGNPLTNAGNIELLVVDRGDGKNGFSVKVTQTWGAGFDLNDSFFNFKEGDIVTITGKATNVPAGTSEIWFESNPGSTSRAIGAKTTISAGNEFEIERTLSQADVNYVRNASPAAIRLRPTENAGNGLEYTITDIKVYRADPNAYTLDDLGNYIDAAESLIGSVATDTDAANVDLGETWATAEDIATFQAVIDAAKALDEDATTDDITAAITALADATAVFEQAIQLGTKTYPPTFNITVNSASQEITVVGVNLDPIGYGSAGVFTGYQYDTIGQDYNGVNYTYFPVDLGGKKLSDFESLKFTATGNGASVQYKAIKLYASSDASEFSIIGGPGEAGVAGGNNFTAGTVNLNILIDGDKADAISESDNVYLAIIWPSDGTIAVCTITNIELYLGDGAWRAPCECNGDSSDAGCICDSCDCEEAVKLDPVTFESGDITLDSLWSNANTVVSGNVATVNSSGTGNAGFTWAFPEDDADFIAFAYGTITINYTAIVTSGSSGVSVKGAYNSTDADLSAYPSFSSTSSLTYELKNFSTTLRGITFQHNNNDGAGEYEVTITSIVFGYAD